MDNILENRPDTALSDQKKIKLSLGTLLVGIMLALDTPEKRDKLMMWMAQHREATPSDIIGKTIDILRMEEHEKL